MSPRFLADANVLSEPLKPSPNPSVLQQIEKNRADLVTASPVWHELLYGCNRLPESKRRATIEEYLWQTLAPSLVILPYDERAAEHHASERARLTGTGRTPPFFDGQIAAIAFVHDLILVTRNIDDFVAFENLRVENWWQL
ncbi:MAG TPA: type II toxin-antitoxin system VapC family toxin [Thermoanaerobaculia bacterium]|nr:type II toxin-antitoxin system VapC family toxin [Thermoanaerobaculia bacterium]